MLHFFVCMRNRKCWMDGIIIHGSHLVIPSVTFLFPLSQLLPVLPINLQLVLLQFTVTLSGVSPLFRWDVGEPWVPPHFSSFRDAPVLRPRYHHFAMQLRDLTAFNKNPIYCTQIGASWLWLALLLPLPSVAYI